jgi:hypothetical protein
MSYSRRTAKSKTFKSATRNGPNQESTPGRPEAGQPAIGNASMDAGARSRQEISSDASFGDPEPVKTMSSVSRLVMLMLAIESSAASPPSNARFSDRSKSSSRTAGGGEGGGVIHSEPGECNDSCPAEEV